MQLFYSRCSIFRDNLDTSSVLESSLSAKEKIISELNMELHNMEMTLSNERELYMSEIKKLSSSINEKVCSAVLHLAF